MNKGSMIFLNTLQNEWRSKTLIFLLAITVMLIFAAASLSSFIFDQFLDANIVGMFGDKTMMVMFWIISGWSTFLAVFLGSGSVRSDMETGVMSQMLSFPVKRFEYLLARIFGTWTIVMLYFVFSIFLCGFVLVLQSKSMVITVGMLGALLTNSLSVLTWVTISVFFSFYAPRLFTFLGVLILSSIVSSANTYFVGKSFSEAFGEVNVYKILGAFFHFLFPRTGNIGSITNGLMLGNEFQTSQLYTFGHFALSFSFITFIIYMVFRRKDF